ncbi:MAG: GAF domain-containing protein [Anaerolineaceae bacterium]|nr:MAG: GAF domain-containing protein [Anaerolineaceae bacterium]
MTSKIFRKRMESLFADFERLATNPVGEAAEIRREIEELRARMLELEADIKKSVQRAAARKKPAPVAPPKAEEKQPQPPRRAAPSLYETERVGFAYAGDAVQPLQGPEKEALTPLDGIKVPLTASGQTIGEVQVQPPARRAWTEEEINLLNAVARQASVQIENLRLLNATERARAEAEDATHRFIHENWEAYLDGIRQSERVGYAYDQASVTPFFDLPALDGGIQETVRVMEEQVGLLYLQPNPARPLTDEERAMVASVAKQIAQQVENIRLLADASHARAEAEEATRRLTRESWQAYAQQQDESNLGFAYDSNQVLPLKNVAAPQETNLTHPLIVRGETIGQLAVANWKDVSVEATELVSAIAERVSTHLETLRLAEELEKHAAELQTVAKLSTTASTVLNPDELLQSVVDLTKERFGLYHAHIYLANEAWQTLLLAAGAGEVGRIMVADQHAIPMSMEQSIVARAFRERQAIIINNVNAEPNHLPNPLLPETRSEMVVPMIVGDQVLGVFDVQSQRANRFTEEDANIYTTLTAQVSVALQNARLYAEQSATLAQLRELDRLKSSFLANMSHELRTPLNSILGFADVILEELDGPLTENMNNDLKLIQKNGQHLLHLINDVLDMAKIEAGRMNLNIEHFQLVELLEEVTSLTSSLASERNDALFIEPGSDQTLEISADRTRMRQVMLNLVNNAIKFTERGKISIRVERRGEMAFIAVKDTGIGIPPDNLETVFQEFTQVDTSTTRKAGGTGLGLPISRRLVEMHGGHLWAESTGVPGEGSTFFVELPIEAQIAEPEKAQK